MEKSPNNIAQSLAEYLIDNQDLNIEAFFWVMLGIALGAKYPEYVDQVYEAWKNDSEPLSTAFFLKTEQICDDIIESEWANEEDEEE